MSLTTRAAIAAGTPQSAAAGARMALQGGNAVDIAVAAGLAATVSEILMCSLGGSGFIMIHLPGQPPELVDGYDCMPGKGRRPGEDHHRGRHAHLPYGDGVEVVVGPGSVAVPGVLAALELAWRRHGTLPWSEVIAPALELAREGAPLAPATAGWLSISGRDVFAYLEESRRCFFPDGKHHPEAGDHFIIPDLAGTMEAIAREGAATFYRGDLSQAIAEDMAQHNGLITRQDLEEYRAKVRRPLMLDSAGFELALNPTPAVGGAAVGSLVGLVEMGMRDDMDAAQRLHLMGAAQEYLLGLRERELLDERFDDERARCLLEAATLRRHLQALRSPHTTHLSVATSEGGLVSITMSMGYGSGVTAKGTGIAFNNSLGEPELNPRGLHTATPGDRLVSNMAPMVGWHPDGRAVSMGSPGASRITTSLAQTWVRYALEGLDAEAAVLAPRLHLERWGDEIRAQYEPGLPLEGLDPAWKRRPFEEAHMYFGGVQLAAVKGRGQLLAVADPRRGGAVRIVE